MPVTGSCHCGAIKYTLAEDPPQGAMACNCSICRRKGYLLHFTTPDKFILHTSRGEITTYTFKSHNIRHQFCKTCGCAPFGEGTGPGGQAVTVINLRCADGVDLDALKVQHVDGASR
ncbi:MAG: GFA family protein [Sphingomonas sp.]|uniref:GFA family protein n=1 Tax=Sphingomonas sp. TaxID=28214 RepID=UPI0025EC8C82|nr:GFA family protein [Sphingomonas sp.]MBX3565493.1 GFA family protein [Sphingomonas sp.]